MKRLYLALALLLCLVLCVFAFASCGKKKAASTTAAETDPAGASTTAEETTAPATTTKKQHAHVPEPDYTVDLEPTCTTPGEKSYYCVECGMKITETTVQIPIDPTRTRSWNGTPTRRPCSNRPAAGPVSAPTARLRSKKN